VSRISELESGGLNRFREYDANEKGEAEDSDEANKMHGSIAGPRQAVKRQQSVQRLSLCWGARNFIQRGEQLQERSCA